MGDTLRVFGAAAKTRALFLFHGSSELQWVKQRPQPGSRVRSQDGAGDWIAADVLQSGADLYTVTCIAPREITSVQMRVRAYLKRDREFVLVALFWSAWALLALSHVLPIWVAFALVAAITAFFSFAWATK